MNKDEADNIFSFFLKEEMLLSCFVQIMQFPTQQCALGVCLLSLSPPLPPATLFMIDFSVVC